MDCLDQRQMWLTLTRINQCVEIHENKTSTNGNNPSYSASSMDLYNPRSILQLLFYFVRPGSDLSCRKFVTCNALSFTMAATSLYNEELRILAYAILERYRKRLMDLSDEVFGEKPIFIYLIRLFKDSIEKANQRLSHFVSHFFARVCKTALTPDDPLYRPLMTFLSLKMKVVLNTAPEFFKLFFSASTEHHLAERQFVLRLCGDALIDAYDYSLFSKVFGPESIMALFPNSMSDLWSKLAILKIFNRCAEIPEAVRDLFLRLNFASWIAITIENEWVTIMEQFELVAVYTKVISKIKPSLQQELETMAIDQAEFGNLSNQEFKELMAVRKMAKSEFRREINWELIKLNNQRILNHLAIDVRIVEEKDIQRRDQLIGLIKSIHD